MLRYILLSVFALLLLTACGGNALDQAGIAQFVDQPSPKSCPGCNLKGVDLTKTDLVEADLTGANLTGADLR
jgi:uncharacterized protein YjbI with pentapeptide repeats